MMPVRVVLDTNCLVSALVFSRGKAARLRVAWQRGEIVPLICRETVTELIRVLGYPKFKLDRQEVENLLADILPWAETVDMDACHDAIALLRDRQDAIFIHLAQSSEAAFLVSGDKHLLELRDLFPALNIIALAEFVGRLGVGS